MLKMFIVRRGCTVPNPLSWPSTKKSDGTEEFAMTGSVDGCSILPETKFVGTCLCVDTTEVFICMGFSAPMEAAGGRLEFDIKPPLGAPLMIFPQGYLLKSFQQRDTSSRQRVLKISFPSPSGGLPMGKPQTCQRWIYLQLSGVRGMHNEGIRARIYIVYSLYLDSK